MTPTDNAVYEERFKRIDEKLHDIHEDQKALAAKVLNGISDRLRVTEADIMLLKNSQERSSLVRNRLEMAIFSTVVPGALGFIWWLIEHKAKSGN